MIVQFTLPRLYFLFITLCIMMVVIITNMLHKDILYKLSKMYSTIRNDSNQDELNMFESTLTMKIINEDGNKTDNGIDLNVSQAFKAETALHNASLRPWYMKGGTIFPIKETGKRTARIYPLEEMSMRIHNQLMFIPPSYNPADDNYKDILLFDGRTKLKPADLKDEFVDCPVNRCKLQFYKQYFSSVDAIVFKNEYNLPNTPRLSHQIWIMYYQECPFHTRDMSFPSLFNWTATYRHDSDIVAPYGYWQYYDPNIKQLDKLEQNFAKNKTKKVAWFVSNCSATNKRMDYVKELRKFIEVHVYGKCGKLICPRSRETECLDMLDKTYKFYLAFENSNCRNYITEKLFVTALGRNILPVVMGGRVEDYERVAPYKSYIHVDEFKGPKQLAEYLHRLDKDDELYNSYFRWKGTGEFINTHFWCRVCALLHDEDKPFRSYNNVNQWWNGTGICTTLSWRKSSFPHFV